MSKVLTFSRVFPAYHPKAGQPTYFVEQIYNSLYEEEGDWSSALGDTSSYVIELNHLIIGKKHHTIRAGHRFNAGDYFSPRVWSGKPYNSKQIVIANDVKIEKVFGFSCDTMSYWLNNGELNYQLSLKEIEKVALNDGLYIDDFECWFNAKEFDGQIICWNENINY